MFTEKCLSGAILLIGKKLAVSK